MIRIHISFLLLLIGWCGPGPDHHMAYAWSLEYAWIMLFLIVNNAFVLGVFGKITYVRKHQLLFVVLDQWT